MGRIEKRKRAVLSTAQNIIKEVQLNAALNFFKDEEAKIVFPSLRQRAKDVVVKNRVYTMLDLERE
jgi:hypothetical protein